MFLFASFEFKEYCVIQQKIIIIVVNEILNVLITDKTYRIIEFNTFT
jgi:hypothetical protein